MHVDLSHQQSLLLHFCFTEQGLKVPFFIVSAIQWIGGYPEAKTTIVNGLWLCLPSCLVTIWPHYFCMFLYAMITYVWLFYFFSVWTMVFGPQRFSRFAWTEIPRYQQKPCIWLINFQNKKFFGTLLVWSHSSIFLLTTNSIIVFAKCQWLIACVMGKLIFIDWPPWVDFRMSKKEQNVRKRFLTFFAFLIC